MRALVVAMLVAAVLVAGCSGGTSSSTNGSPSPSPGGTPPASPPAASPSPSSSSGAMNYAVSLVDNRYEPTTMDVPNFQKVVFTNKGTLSHTVTIVRQGDAAGTFLRDQAIQPNTSADYNFPNDGSYVVYCRYHGSETSGMHMTITV